MKSTGTRAIKAAVLVADNVGPRDLSRVLDVAFEDVDDVLQFVVEGHGWTDDADATKTSLMDAFMEDVT